MTTSDLSFFIQLTRLSANQNKQVYEWLWDRWQETTAEGKAEVRKMLASGKGSLKK